MTNKGIYSDIGLLEAVLLHIPSEGEWIFDPQKSNDLLLDGPLNYFKMIEEIQEFIRIIKLFGVDVYLVKDLIMDVLKGNSGQRELMLDQLVRGGFLDLNQGEKNFILNENKVNDSDFVNFILSGFYPASRKGFKMNPLPNIIFTRDIMAIVRDKVFWSFNRAKKARSRESFIVKDLVQNHSVFSKLQDAGSNEMARDCTIEGGDVMPISENLVLIGYSSASGARTSSEGIKHIARNLIPEGCAVLVVEFTKHQSKNTIHLDTILTFVGKDYCLCYQPIFGASHRGQVGIGYYLLQSQEDIDNWPRDNRDFFKILHDFNLDVQPIYCDESDRYNGSIPKMEQCRMGVNTLALAPEIIIGYESNYRTASALEKKGFKIVSSKDINSSIDFRSPMLVTLSVSELIIARGGPHCLSMPIQRKR